MTNRWKIVVDVLSSVFALFLAWDFSRQGMAKLSDTSGWAETHERDPYSATWAVACMTRYRPRTSPRTSIAHRSSYFSAWSAPALVRSCLTFVEADVRLNEARYARILVDSHAA